jgi:hypothetical protein
MPARSTLSSWPTVLLRLPQPRFIACCTNDAGLGREVGVPIRLANMAYEELTEADLPQGSFVTRCWRKGDSNRQSLSLALPDKPSIAVVPFIKCDR